MAGLSFHIDLRNTMHTASVLFSPKQNQILAALTESDFESILPHLELVPMPLGLVLCGSGEMLFYAYFPITSSISLLYILEEGLSMEIALIGNEGIFGLRLLMGNNNTPSRAVVQNAGFGYRIKSKLLIDQFNQVGSLMRLTLRYAQALITHMTQTAACNRHHPIEQQLCRWILLTLDRIQGNHLRITHESIGQMLGVRRESISQAASDLQRLEIIAYTRGSMHILNHAGLKNHSCECYQVVKNEYDRLMPRKVTRISHNY
jgi:CRP-like cAMP-binding protein